MKLNDSCRKFSKAPNVDKTLLMTDRSVRPRIWAVGLREFRSVTKVYWGSKVVVVDWFFIVVVIRRLETFWYPWKFYWYRNGCRTRATWIRHRRFCPSRASGCWILCGQFKAEVSPDFTHRPLNLMEKFSSDSTKVGYTLTSGKC